MAAGRLGAERYGVVGLDAGLVLAAHQNLGAVGELRVDQMGFTELFDGQRGRLESAIGIAVEVLGPDAESDLLACLAARDRKRDRASAWQRDRRLLVRGGGDFRLHE